MADSETKRKSWRDDLRIHEAAEMFPMMSDAELDELAADIAANGIQTPIVWLGNRLLDGRNRVAAVSRIPGARREQLIRELKDGKHCIVHRTLDDPAGYVVSANIRRRHLTPEQKREVIAKFIALDPTKSDRQIAKQVRSDHKTVSKARKEAEDVGKLPHVETRKDSRGRQQPAAKPSKRRLQDSKHGSNLPAAELQQVDIEEEIAKAGAPKVLHGGNAAVVPRAVSGPASAMLAMVLADVLDVEAFVRRIVADDALAALALALVVVLEPKALSDLRARLAPASADEFPELPAGLLRRH